MYYTRLKEDEQLPAGTVLPGGFWQLTDEQLAQLDTHDGPNHTLWVIVGFRPREVFHDVKLYNSNVAGILGMTDSGWRGTVAQHRERLKPNGREIERGHARPWWWRSTIEAWQATRAGKGRRSDLLADAGT